MLPLPRLVSVAVTALVLATSAQECETSGSSGDDREQKACDFRPAVRIKNRIEIEPDRPVIVARATAECDKAPRVHTFSLTLQQQDEDGTWGMGPSDNSNNIPRPGHDVTLRVVHGCYPGTWRAVARASGKGPNRDPFDFTDITVREVTRDDCGYRQDR